MSQLDDALSQVGVDLQVDSPTQAVSNFNAENASAQAQAQALAGVSTIATAAASATILPPGFMINGTLGEWQSPRYAADLNAHHPKFKFLFKVKFEGFPGNDIFYYYAVRADKPKVKINHADINYYNFRTRVMTNVSFDPLTILFYDEIGNSVSDFFASYLSSVSQQGAGNWGSDRGLNGVRGSSSTIPYANAYSKGKSITVEQIFGNGTLSNRYTMINPRIEALDFDELAADDNNGSLLSVSFSYDALKYETVANSTIHSWGMTDLLYGGGTSGLPNAGLTEVGEAGVLTPLSVSGSGLGIGTGGAVPKQPATAYAASQLGYKATNLVPPSLSDLVNPIVRASGLQPVISTFNQIGTVSSSQDVVSRNIQETLGAIQSGTNMVFGGRTGPSTLSDVENQGANTAQPTSNTQTFPYSPVPPVISSGG